MRLKEDNSSWRASSILRKVVPLPDEPKKPSSRKNTRKWCKGVVGREHEWGRQHVGHPYTVEDNVTENICAACGKRDYKTRSYNGQDFWEWLDARRVRRRATSG